MRLLPAETSLVIAGAWNAAILTPEWVLKHGLENEIDKQIQVFFPAGTGGAFEFPRFVLNEFSYVVRPNALVLSPQETTASKLKIIEAAAERIVSVLKHTPISGIGHNFEFRNENPSSDQLNVFTTARQDIADNLASGWTPAASTLASSFAHADGKVIVNIQRTSDASTVSIKFNFHYPISTFDQTLQILRSETGYTSMADNLDMAQKLINSMYGDTDGDQH